MCLFLSLIIIVLTFLSVSMGWFFWSCNVSFFSSVGIIVSLSSIVFFVSLIAIVLCILVFCADYLTTTRDYLRFVIVLLSFVLRMVILITHSSLFILFLG